MASGSALAPFLREARRILGIGLPIFIAQLSQIGMNFVDTVMTGHYSASSMAAVAVAGSVWAPAMLLAIGCLLALPGMGAQLAGARRPGDCAHPFRQGVPFPLPSASRSGSSPPVSTPSDSKPGSPRRPAPTSGP